MKRDRDKALVEVLKFAYETNLGRLRDSGRIKTWNRLESYLFWDMTITTLPPHEPLERIQEVLRGFLDEYFMSILNLYQSSQWRGTPSNEVDMLAQVLLSEKKVKTYKGALKRVKKDNPQLWEIYNAGEWRKYFPEPRSKRRFVYVNGEALLYREEGSSLKELVVEQVIKLFAMKPLSLSRLYRCQECQKWSINTRKSRKHWFCSKRCYDRSAKRAERSTLEGREAYRKKQKARYRKKVLGEG